MLIRSCLGHYRTFDYISPLLGSSPRRLLVGVNNTTTSILFNSTWIDGYDETQSTIPWCQKVYRRTWSYFDVLTMMFTLKILWNPVTWRDSLFDDGGTKHMLTIRMNSSSKVHALCTHSSVYPSLFQLPEWSCAHEELRKPIYEQVQHNDVPSFLGTCFMVKSMLCRLRSPWRFVVGHSIRFMHMKLWTLLVRNLYARRVSVSLNLECRFS